MKWFGEQLQRLNEDRQKRLREADSRRWLLDADREINASHDSEPLAKRIGASSSLNNHILRLAIKNVGLIATYQAVEGSVKFLPNAVPAVALAQEPRELKSERDFQDHLLHTLWRFAEHHKLVD